MNKLSLLTDIFKEDVESGALKLDINFARKPIKDKTLGTITLLEALFHGLSIPQAAVLFSKLRDYETEMMVSKILNITT